LLPMDVVEALDRAWMGVKAIWTNYWHLDLEYMYGMVASLFGKDGRS
jgi:hypothetical protein